MHFDQYIAYWSKHRADALYMSFGDEELTWSQLDKAGGELAAYLIEIGVKPGDRVGCQLANCLEWCVAFAAAIRLGAIMVPLNVAFGPFELKEIAANADCAAVVSTPANVAKLGVADDAPADRIAVYDLHGKAPPKPYSEIVGGGRVAPRNPANDEDIIAICYTSGTTGVPKGIALTHGRVDLMNTRVARGFGWKSGEERFLILAPLAFTGGIISNLTAQLLIGASGYLEKQADPARALNSLIENRITFMGGVPALWERIAAAPGFDEATLYLTSAGTGGAPVPVELLKRFIAKGVVIRQQFGVSENCGTISFPDTESATVRPEACGPPVPGVEVEIRDDDGKEVPQGVIGEICIRSDQIMRGYWNRPEETAKAFDGEWYKTGDLGRLDEYGAIVVADRKKNMLISGGVNIYPAEVERALMQIEGMTEVVVLGVPSETWGQEVVAVCHGAALPEPAAIVRKARDLIGPMKAPKQVVLSREPLPKTVSNKIARTNLVELFEQVRAAGAR